MYRTIKYQGDNMKALIKRIEEINTRKEQIINFSIETYEGGE
jgi:hypothetical protein